MDYRLDSQVHHLEWEKLDNGNYRAYGVLGKTNHPLRYYKVDNGKLVSWVETIEEDELFREDSLHGCWGLPVTWGHPVSGEFDRNAEKLLVGSTMQEFQRTDDGELLVPVVVQDARGIEEIDRARANGQHVELSPGYSIAGTRKRKDGVMVQVGRSYDHLALLAPGLGRGGKTLSLRTDRQDLPIAIEEGIAPLFFPNLSSTPQSKTPVTPPTPIQGVETMDLSIQTATGERIFRDVPEGLGEAVKSLQVANAELTQKLTTAKERIDSIDADLKIVQESVSRKDGEIEGLRVKLENAESQRLDDAAISAEIQGRLEVWEAVLPAFRTDNKDFSPDYSMPVTEIRRSYIAKVAPNIKLDGRDDEFIAGLWEGLKPDASQVRNDAKSRDRVNNIYQAVTNATATTGINNLDDARQRRRAAIEAVK